MTKSEGEVGGKVNRRIATSCLGWEGSSAELATQSQANSPAHTRRARDAAATISRRQGCAVRRKQSVAPAVYHHAMCRSSGWRRRDLERASRLTSIFHMDTILLRGEASARLPLSRCRGADDGR